MNKASLLILVASLAGCSPQIYRQDMTDPRCRYEANMATVGLGCEGCFVQNIRMLEIRSQLYEQCLAARGR